MTASRFGLLMFLLCTRMFGVVPQATSREELDAFGLVYDAPDGLGKIKACESFLSRYPKSAFVEKVWQLEFETFTLRGDSAAALRVGRTIIAMDGHEAETLSKVSVLLASSPDPAERMSSTDYALRAIKEVAEMHRPEEMPRARYVAWKHETLARSHATLGEVALRRSESASALREFQEVVGLVPTQGEYWKLLALAHFQLKQYAEASRALQEAATLSPELDDVNLLLGIAQFNTRQYKDSAIALALAVASNPSDREAYLYLMRDYVALDTFDLGIAERAASSFPHDAELLFEVGQAALDHIRNLVRRADDLGRDSREFKELEARKREIPSTGAVSPLVGEYDRTATVLDRCFEGVSQEAADSSYGRRVRGYMAESQNHVEEALADYRAGGDHFAAGRLLAQNVRYEEAVTEFEAELSLHPDNHLALAELSQVYVQLGKLDLARPILDQLLALYPGDAYAWLDKGRIEQKASDWQGAVVSFKKALSIDPGLSAARYRLATVYRNLGDDAAAADELAAFRTGLTNSR